MTDKTYSIEMDHLALALTRAPMFMGVNIRLFFANVVLCTLVCINANTFWGVPLFVLFHLLMVKFSIKEANFFSIWVRSFLKTPPGLNSWYWGGTNSYEQW